MAETERGTGELRVEGEYRSGVGKTFRRRAASRLSLRALCLPPSPRVKQELLSGLAKSMFLEHLAERQA